jgi:hypothetical protein
MVAFWPMLAGAAFGAAAIQGLHAQAKPPVYTVSEIQITNLDAYLNSSGEHQSRWRQNPCWRARNLT